MSKYNRNGPSSESVSKENQRGTKRSQENIKLFHTSETPTFRILRWMERDFNN